MTDALTTLWTQQYRDAAPLDTDALARADTRFRARIRRRDWIEYLAGAIGAGAFCQIALKSSDWGVRFACIAVLVGTAVVMRNLWRRRPSEPEYGAPSLAFHRATLVAQRDALASVWRWYLAPIIPGLILFQLATVRASAEHLPLIAALAVGATGFLIVGAVFWGIHRLNLAAARRLQRMIDALDPSQGTER